MRILVCSFGTLISSLFKATCCVAVFAVPLSSGHAQQFGNPGQGGNIATVQIKGELQDSDGKVLQIKKEDGKSIYVMMPQEIRNMEFQSDVTPKQLMSGMLARFRIDYEAMAKPTLSVKSIDLFPPNEMAIFKPRTPKERAEYVPGVYYVSQIGNDPNSKEVQIVAEVVGVKDGVLVVNAESTLQIKLDDQTKMKFRTASLEYAKQGNQVEGSGISSDPQGVQVAGTRITIIGKLPEQSAQEDKPAAKEKTKSKRKSRREPKAPKDADKKGTSDQPASSEDEKK